MYLTPLLVNLSRINVQLLDSWYGVWIRVSVQRRICGPVPVRTLSHNIITVSTPKAFPLYFYIFHNE